MKQLIILIVLAIGITSGYAQNYGQEVQKIFKEFALLRSYSIKSTVTVHGEDGYSFDASIKSSDLYGTHVKADITEVIMNKNYMIVIDHDEKSIRISKGNFKAKRSKVDTEEFGVGLIGQYINENTTVNFLEAVGNVSAYEIINEDELSRVVVKIDTENHFFIEIEVFYNHEDITIPSYKVTYTEFKRNPAFEKSEFNERIVFSKSSGGDLVATALYKGYTILLEESEEN